MQPEGLHVAFCAGTGALVFLDLVSQILLLNTFKADGKAFCEELKFFGEGFKFHLYCAFQSREQAIGLELIEALENVNQVLGVDNFKVTVRLSETEGPKLPRWTPEYIEKELLVSQGKIQKIWVCGPPAMNEMFDKTLGNLTDKLQISSD